ncbi:MAG: glycine zipper 2TM domain-containing protein [Pseudomonadota bacterium]
MTSQFVAVKAPQKLFAGAFAALAFAVAGCQSSSGANTVSSSSVGYAMTVKPGVVTNVRAVTIKPDRSIIGTATGAVLGGLAGSELGGGDKAQTAGAIGGAVLGGIAGNAIGTAAGTQQGLGVTVEFDDGNVKAFIQPADTNIQPGQRVNVEFREDGAYVVPLQYAGAF